MIQRAIILLIILATAPMAYGVSAGGDHHIPWSQIIAQAVNFTLTLLLLYFLTRKSVSAHFKSRKAEFSQELQQAQAALMEAELKNKKIKERLAKLENTADESLERAKSEAEDLKHKIISDAEKLAQKLLKDAQGTAQLQLEKAIAHLREDLLEGSVAMAKATLKEKVGDPDQKRLHNEFVEKIQVVR